MAKIIFVKNTKNHTGTFVSSRNGNDTPLTTPAQAFNGELYTIVPKPLDGTIDLVYNKSGPHQIWRGPPHVA